MVEKSEQIPNNIVQRLDFLRTHSNYHGKSQFVYDKLTLHMFVSYYKLDLQGNIIHDKKVDPESPLIQKPVESS